MGKKRAPLEIRGPDEPSESDKEAWVRGEVGEDKAQLVNEPPEIEEKERKTETVETAAPSKPRTSRGNKAKEEPSGPGIVEYADGTFRRRTTIYLPVELAKQLRVKAAVENRKLNDLVCAAVDAYLDS